MFAPQYVGYATNTRTLEKIADWQELIPSDKHSIALLPDFVK
jgi:hypothetical protein